MWWYPIFTTATVVYGILLAVEICRRGAHVRNLMVLVPMGALAVWLGGEGYFSLFLHAGFSRFVPDVEVWPPVATAALLFSFVSMASTSYVTAMIIVGKEKPDNVGS